MSNSELLTAGTDPEQIDPIFGTDGTVYLKAAGDSFGVPTGNSDPAAPQAVQVRTAARVASVTPTLDTNIYASGDSLHTAVLSFTSAVRVSGGTGRVRKMIVIDKDLQSIALELWLFSATVTPAAANAAHSISDADAALCVGVVPSGTYYASALNSISVTSVDIPISCAATTLFGILVTRGTPTYTASGLVVALQLDTL